MHLSSNLNNFVNMLCIYHYLANILQGIFSSINFQINNIYLHIYCNYYHHTNYNFQLCILNKLYFRKNILRDINFSIYFPLKKNFLNILCKIFHHNFYSLKDIVYTHYFFQNILQDIFLNIYFYIV